MLGFRAAVYLLAFGISLIGDPEAVLATEPWQESVPSPIDPQTPAAAPSQGEPAVQIDQLLKLPTSYRVDDVRKGGATRVEWRARFDEARMNLAAMEKKLAKVRAEMGEIAGSSSQWQMAPPGADVKNSDNPTNFRLTQELRRGREDVKHAEKKLTDLDIEANLASVPEDWRL